MLESTLSVIRKALVSQKTSNHAGLPGLWEMLQVNWHLGVTSFGGPAVHFQIVSTPYQQHLKPNTR
jgi:hypothetical protein